MAASAGDPDIQANVSVLLDGYPFLKVFSRPPEVDIFSEPIFTILEYIRGLLFRINFEGSKAVSVSPYFMDNHNKPLQRDIDNADEKKRFYTKHKSLIEGYISYQLINSGILDVLANVPNVPCTNDMYDRTEPDATGRRMWIPAPPFQSSICIRLNPRKKSIDSIYYHNDSTLFQILQYSQSRKPYVLGSELLFYHENDDTIVHQGIVRTKENIPFFPEETYGSLVHDKYELVKNIYKNIRTSGLTPPLFRHKLNNGDTVVFPDTLIKHAVINPKEHREGTTIHIDIANKINRDNKLGVTVCSERVITDQSEYDGRSIVGLFCFINKSYMDPVYFLEPFLLNTIVPIPIPQINLNEEHCTAFLSQLSKGDGCINIGGVEIKHRGGKMLRLRNKVMKRSCKKKYRKRTSQKKGR